MKHWVMISLLIMISIPVMGLSPPDFTRDDIISGSAIIVDGDTVEIGGIRIEFFGIDAPEIDQSCRIFGLDWPCGERARVLLVRLVGKGQIRCLPRGNSATGSGAGPLKAMCFNEGTLNLNAALIGEGMAVANLNDGDWFAVANTTARVNRKGFWAGEFISPADWRLGRRLVPLGSRSRKALIP